MYHYLKDKFLEDEYIISDEMKDASIFGIGNGYFGIRGSFEEFGDVFVQGTYVRGVFDKIIEIPETVSDNSYMKKYYFDEQKLKEFEYEDSCINIGDITAFRIYIGGKPFRMWNYKLKSYRRYLDFDNGGLSREIVVEDELGNATSMTFHRVCSFACDHLFLQSLTIKKLNHDLPIFVESGIDLLCKTNGQHKLGGACFSTVDGKKCIRVKYGDKYRMSGLYLYKNETQGFASAEARGGCYGSYESFKLIGGEGRINKAVAFYANIDGRNIQRSAAKALRPIWSSLYESHLRAYQKAFKKVDVKVYGNDVLDTLLRYANYQTLIGFNRHDHVHSLSAKNLTAEKYNQFVWWDCEIYQMPFFLLTYPKECKNLLLYRYNRLKASEENAKAAGYKGAKYAFCSSVNGDEQVWIYAKHPFLQIHINGDVAYAVLNYYYHTLDRDFLLECGFPMIEEIIEYFISRSTFDGTYYRLKCVTGTDEHHDYVDDDAYTNVTLGFVLKEFIRLKGELGYRLTKLSEEELTGFASKLYQPEFVDGILPQFDGYLNLSKELIVEGKSDKKASSFQMKQSGLYHLSQVIKQPDVLLLYSYLNLGFEKNYRQNYEYYLARCEASSSLTYCVHALSAIDNGDLKGFEDNLNASLRIDIDDVQGNAGQGVHAGSLASGFFLFVRGILGAKAGEGFLEISPKLVDLLSRFKLTFVYHGVPISVDYRGKRIILSSKSPFRYRLNGSETGEATRLALKYDKQIHIYKKEETI